MQTTVKIDIRSLLFNGAMQKLHVKIVVIIFVILMFLLR